MAVPLGSAFWLVSLQRAVHSDFNATFSDGWSANFSKFNTSITYKQKINADSNTHVVYTDVWARKGPNSDWRWRAEPLSSVLEQRTSWFWSGRGRSLGCSADSRNGSAQARWRRCNSWLRTEPPKAFCIKRKEVVDSIESKTLIGKRLLQLIAELSKQFCPSLDFFSTTWQLFPTKNLWVGDPTKFSFYF